MLFHTWVFAVFFLIVYPVFLLVRKNNRLMNIWLMIASYTFYGWWNPVYLLLLFGTSAIDYAMVLLMERSGPRGRKLWLIISLVSNFGFLGYFKYSGFLTANINALFDLFRDGLAVTRSGCLSEQCPGVLWAARGPAFHAGNSADRDLLPHVPVDELHDRRLSRA